MFEWISYGFGRQFELFRARLLLYTKIHLRHSLRSLDPKKTIFLSNFDSFLLEVRHTEKNNDLINLLTFSSRSTGCRPNKGFMGFPGINCSPISDGLGEMAAPPVSVCHLWKEIDITTFDKANRRTLIKQHYILSPLNKTSWKDVICTISLPLQLSLSFSFLKPIPEVLQITYYIRSHLIWSLKPRPKLKTLTTWLSRWFY